MFYLFAVAIPSLLRVRTLGFTNSRRTFMHKMCGCHASGSRGELSKCCCIEHFHFVWENITVLPGKKRRCVDVTHSAYIALRYFRRSYRNFPFIDIQKLARLHMVCLNSATEVPTLMHRLLNSWETSCWCNWTSTSILITKLPKSAKDNSQLLYLVPSLPFWNFS